MPTDWNNCYRAGDTPWDKGAPAPPLLEWLDAPGHRFDGEVLVPGCGFGHDVRAIAATGQAAQVWGLDISPAALDQANRWPKTGNETYVEGDLFDLLPEWRGHFDWVFEHTCFCAIDPARRPDYVGAVAHALRPGGRLLAVFYLNPWKEGEPTPPNGGPPFGVNASELDAIFASHFELQEEYIPNADAGQRGAILDTLIESCRRRGLDPHAYLRDVLARLPSTTNWQIKDITPAAWGRFQRAAMPSRSS